VPFTLNRHSPDDSRTGVNNSDFLAPWKHSPDSVPNFGAAFAIQI
jgi:hypothetical protein